MTTESNPAPSAIKLAVELTIAWLSNPHTRASAEDVRAFLTMMRDSVVQLTGAGAIAGEETPSVSFSPAVSVRKSLASKDHIISMIDGKPYKTLRRHLNGHDLSAEEYRARYNLKADYPLVAEAYSEVRRAMAKKIGLGRKPGPLAAPTDPIPPKRQKLKLPMITE